MYRNYDPLHTFRKIPFSIMGGVAKRRDGMRFSRSDGGKGAEISVRIKQANDYERNEDTTVLDTRRKKLLN